MTRVAERDVDAGASPGDARRRGGRGGRMSMSMLAPSLSISNDAAKGRTAFGRRGSVTGAFWRMSLDQQLQLQDDDPSKSRSKHDNESSAEELDSSGSSRNTATQSSAVSDYQRVFRQMKSENPLCPLGALRQKTMARIAELEGDREARELRRGGGVRSRNQNLAKKYVDRWVGKMAGGGAPGESHWHAALHAHERGDQNVDGNATAGGEIFAHLVPTGSRMAMRRQSFLESRRSSLDSSAYTWCSDEVNFAPRRSVGDMSCATGGSVAAQDPILDLLSDASDDDESVAASPSGGNESTTGGDHASPREGKNRGVRRKQSVAVESESKEFIVDGLIVGFVDRSKSKEEDGDHDEYNIDGLIVEFGNRRRRTSEKWGKEEGKNIRQELEDDLFSLSIAW